jgi:hypothetical protein
VALPERPPHRGIYRHYTQIYRLKTERYEKNGLAGTRSPYPIAQAGNGTRDTRNSLLKKDVIEGLNDMSDLIIALKKKFIYLNENYICTSISELHDLYDRFVKYIINYHYEQIYKLTNRTFLANSPIYENDKENYKKKINNIGFKNEFDRYGLKIDIHD